ncbi:MAG: hypothetical protein Pg6C_18340 [Treponemataceae bacterium]|nr:MAG: hypothetical protein Pg6C_18340 [Treponemataceae bacterium]
MTGKKPELKPCPFCGGKARIESGYGRHDDGFCFVLCENCYAETAEEKGEESAAARWNRRARDA